MNYLRYFYKEQDKISFWAVIFTLVSISFMLVPFFIFSLKLPTQIPLFYSLPWGDKVLALKNQYLLLPSLTAVVLFINLFFAYHLHHSQVTIKRVLIVSTSVISLVFLVAGVRIISIFI